MPKGYKSGVKQRVLKKICSARKRKAFKGTPKHREIAENASKRPRIEITFVSEDDVLSSKFRSHLPLFLRESYRKVTIKVDLMRVPPSKCQWPRDIGSCTWKVFESLLRGFTQPAKIVLQVKLCKLMSKPT